MVNGNVLAKVNIFQWRQKTRLQRYAAIQHYKWYLILSTHARELWIAIPQQVQFSNCHCPRCAQFGSWNCSHNLLFVDTHTSSYTAEKQNNCQAFLLSCPPCLCNLQALKSHAVKNYHQQPNFAVWKFNIPLMTNCKQLSMHCLAASSGYTQRFVASSCVSMEISCHFSST